MKKICIVTFHNAHNYGAVLQAFALCKILKKINKNNDIKIINYKNKNIMKQYKLFTPVRKNIIKWFRLIAKDIKNYHLNIQRFTAFDNFIKNNLALTRSFKTEKKIKKNPPLADIYITGSDQVWNPGIVGGVSDIYTLNFGDSGIKKISYAASIGNVNNIDKHTDEFVKKLHKLNHISIREESCKEKLEKVLSRNVAVVLDPTLLLTVNDWEKEIKDIKRNDEKYILAYMVEKNDEFIKITNELSNKEGYKVIHFKLDNLGLKNILKSAYTAGPLEFINYIKNAEYIVTTSFHATVFSIIFNKKFWVIPHATTGATVIDLLTKVGISNRVVNTLEEFEEKNYSEEIDYKKVNQKLEDERNKSLHWLINAIEE